MRQHKQYLRAGLILLLLPVLSLTAYAADGQNENLLQRITTMFQSGGGIMWAMLGASVIGLTYAIERMLSLRLKNYYNKDYALYIYSLLESTDLDEVTKLLQEKPLLIARCFKGVIVRSSGSREEMERGIDDDLSRALWDERKNIKPIGLVASVSPLIGLLGTVIGMITAFRQAAENGMSDPAIFAGGIYQALYTTAFGLVLAIPFFLIYHYLRTKSEQIMRKIEDESLIFVDKTLKHQQEQNQAPVQDAA